MPKLFVTKGKAGLGNRMLCAATALLYAHISRRRLIVDWADFVYSNDGTNSFSRLFECFTVSEEDFASGVVTVHPPIWQRRLGKSANDLLDEFDPDKHSSPLIQRKYSADLSRLDYSEDVLVMWSFTHQIPVLRRHFTGVWERYARMSDREILSEIFRKDIVPSSLVRSKVDAFQAAHFQSPMIGVHVRFMDRKAKIGHFISKIDVAVARLPEAAIFLATDNVSVEKELRERYKRVVVTPKWFPSGGVSMHQNSECPDRLQNGIDALTDLYLLSKCDYLIYPGSSTFSYIASLLIDAPKSQVVDIERYNLRIRAKRLIRSLIA